MVVASKINLYTYKELKNEVRFNKSEIMADAWWYFRKGGMTFSEALKKAWDWAKRWVTECREQIVKFEILDKKIKADYEARKNKPTESADAWMNADSMSRYYNSNAYKGD
ncbi:MAG: hypothetical protein ACK5KP_09385 [Paludibacteraceae bacterium]